jgi:hypothetical protein
LAKINVKQNVRRLAGTEKIGWRRVNWLAQSKTRIDAIKIFLLMVMPKKLGSNKMKEIFERRSIRKYPY